MKFTLGPNWILQPDGRVNSLLSSKTEFKDSIHSGSTSPSHKIHECTSVGRNDKENCNFKPFQRITEISLLFWLLWALLLSLSSQSFCEDKIKQIQNICNPDLYLLQQSSLSLPLRFINQTTYSSTYCIRKQLCMDTTVITQLYCQLYITCQLHVSANTTWVDPKFSGLVPPSAQQLC